MEKSILEAEALLFWKIARDLNRPTLARHERRELSEEMEGFAMNATDIRVRRLAAASLEALANTMRAEPGAQKHINKSNQRTLEVSVNSIENGWGEFCFVAQVEFSRRIYLEFLEMVKSEFSERNGRELGANGFRIEICSLREGWDEVALSAPAAFVKRVSREFGELFKPTYEASEG